MKVFIDPRMHRVFERHIVRAYESPTLFDPELLPMKRTFLFYGQPGIGADDAVFVLLKKHKLDYHEINVGRDPAPVNDALSAVNSPPVPILWIRNGHLLQYHRELFLQTLELEKTTSYLFIIVTGEEIPDDTHPFYQQFDSITPIGLPKKDHLEHLMEYYFTRWRDHWKYSQMLLTSDDFKWLAISADFCTPRDVELFVQKVFGHVMERYPEQSIDITRELLEDQNNQFMYESLSVSGIFCITNRDAQTTQLKFDPAGATDAIGLEEAGEREKKRAKIKE